MIHMGKQQLTRQAKEIHEATVRIADYIRKELKELTLFGDPRVNKYYKF